MAKLIGENPELNMDEDNFELKKGQMLGIGDSSDPKYTDALFRRLDADENG